MMRLLTAAAAFMLLSIAAPASAQLLSPGQLTRWHRSLEGEQNCQKCHQEGKRIAKTRCLDCHKELATRINAGRGLHGREYRNRKCEQCHVEHQGRTAPLIKWPDGGRDNFDHALTGWRLLGKHGETACNDCHTGRNESGGRTYLGLTNRCSSCHEDNHNGRFGNNCAECHNERGWKQVNINEFDHTRTRFPLRGQHQQLECHTCHGDPPQWKGLKFASCSDCHADPHEGRLGAGCKKCHSETGFDDRSRIRQNHPGVSLANGHGDVACATCHGQALDRPPAVGNDCVNCHSPVHEANFGNGCKQCHAEIKWLGLPRRIGLRAHGKTPFELKGRHRAVQCSSCHKPELPPDRRYRKLNFGRCTDCHSDQHEGAFRERDNRGNCTPCHTERGFLPTRFGVRLHETTAFPLEGKHEAVPCGACHTGRRPRVSLSIDERACADCHANPHGDQFREEMARNGCATCHSALGWNQPNIDHSIWPLTGAHGLTPCVSCHQPSDDDRLRGEGASYRGVPRECAGCHEDIHMGQFVLSQPVRECDECHTTSEFALPNFRHQQMTGYALEGQHRQIECGDCHKSETLRNGQTAVRYRLGYNECADCHANPHEEDR